MKVNARTIICQNCPQAFTIKPDDFAFYERIGVPPPTFCPQCRQIRRMTWRNERNLYRRKDAFGKELLSSYSPETAMIVYDRNYWWTDSWDPMDHGRDYDFSRSFFEQFRDLLSVVPAPNVFSNNVVNSPYANHVGYMKNCYLVFASWECENIFYGENIIRSKDSVDCHGLIDSELCYEAIDCEKSQRLRFCRDCEACFDSMLLYDCRNCSDCFGCIGLRNKKYHIFNQPYSKEEYIEKIKSFQLDNNVSLQKAQKEFLEFADRYPRRFAHLINTVNVIGDHCFNMKNCYYCFDLPDVENSKYITYGGIGLKDSYDGYGVGASTELLYEGIDTGVNGSKERFSIVVYACRDTDYCFNCENSSDLFGCIGLRKKQYCIFNKQYSKEEYEMLRERIIEQMTDLPFIDKRGVVYSYGEFFPSEISPFAYNETIAQEYFPLTEKDAAAAMYRWRSADGRSYTVTKATADIPNSILEVDDTILKEVIACEHAGNCNDQCTTAFRITPEELQFYRRLVVPLPRLCPNCRQATRVHQRNPLQLWHRICDCTTKKGEERYKNTAPHFHGVTPCSNEFETSYAPERPEVVYCEACYNAETV